MSTDPPKEPSYYPKNITLQFYILIGTSNDLVSKNEEIKCNKYITNKRYHKINLKKWLKQIKTIKNFKETCL